MSRRPAIVTQAGNDQPLRLDVAASLAFPDGSMTASGLRREAGKGRLVIERIAGKDYTTVNEIEKMRVLCRLVQKARVSGFAGSAAVSAEPHDGSSETEAISKAQAALRTILQEPNARSPDTSQPSTPARRRASATVTRLSSRSRIS
jgi:hypothetical protein